MKISISIVAFFVAAGILIIVVGNVAQSVLAVSVSTGKASSCTSTGASVCTAGSASGSGACTGANGCEVADHGGSVSCAAGNFCGTIQSNINSPAGHVAPSAVYSLSNGKFANAGLGICGGKPGVIRNGKTTCAS